MKILFLSAAVTLSLATSTTVAAADPSGFNNVLSSLSNLLSSTNPKVVTYQAMEPAVGEDMPTAPTMTKLHVTDEVESLPPLPGTPPKEVAAPQPIIQPEVDMNRLSPQTRQMLQSTPAGIGEAPKTPGGKLSLKRGDFDPEYGRYIDAPIDVSEKAGAPINPDKINNSEKVENKTQPAKKAMDIKVEAGSRNADNSNIINLLEQGLSALNTGQYEGAMTLYKSVLQKDPRNRDAMFGLATAYQKAGQKVQAREAYSRLLSAYPNYEPALNNILVMASNEAPEDALKELQKLEARNPSFAAVYAQKGAIYAKMGDGANAKTNMIKAANLEPNNIIYLYNLAILVDQMGEIENASSLYNKLLEQSAKGAQLPVERSQISDRLAYIASQHQNPQL